MPQPRQFRVVADLPFLDQPLAPDRQRHQAGISGDVGVSPGSAVTGFPPGSVTNGTIHAADAVATQAEVDLTTAYNVNVWKIVAASRSEPMSYFRVTATTVFVLALITAAVSIPLPWYIEAPFLIEPHDAAQVLTSVPGQLTSFAVHAGDTVQKGQLLATLRDDEKEDQWLQLTTARESQQAEIAMLHALDMPAEHAVAMRRLHAIDRQILDLQEQLDELCVRAPISGLVVEAPLVPVPPNDLPRHLPTWSGQIGHPGNLGCLVPGRTHLLSIAPDDRMQAVLYLDQANRDDLSVTQQIQIKFEHLADRTYRAQVTEIAHEHSDRAPAGMTSRQGGELASTTDPGG